MNNEKDCCKILLIRDLIDIKKIMWINLQRKRRIRYNEEEEKNCKIRRNEKSGSKDILESLWWKCYSNMPLCLIMCIPLIQLPNKGI